MKSTEFERYPEYKRCQLELFEKMPSHWEMLANKYIFKLKKTQVGKRSNEYDLLSLTLKGIIKRDMENPEGKFPADFDTYQEVKKGDFIFCLFDVEETPRTVGLSNYDGMITGAYTVLEASDKFDKKYIYYFYLNLDLKKRLKMLYKGLRNTISKDSFFSFKTFIPPLQEQMAIAKFLDEKCNKIDKAIAQKERLIELLSERKQVIIQKSVTKGLNPEVEMKNSEVRWIGEIPKHWKVKKLKYVSKINIETLSEKTDKKLLIDYVDIGSVTLKDGIQKIEKYFFENAPSRARRIAKSGDTIVSTVRTYLKAIDYIDGEKCKYIYSTGFAVISPNSFFNPKFLTYFIKSDAFTNQVNVNSKGVSYPAINTTELSNLKVVICSIEEQEEIVSYVEEESKKIDNIVSLQEKQIQKLKEYREILIDNAVTGKIKVGD